MSCDSVATHMLQSLHTHMDISTGIKAQMIRFSRSVQRTQWWKWRSRLTRRNGVHLWAPLVRRGDVQCAAVKPGGKLPFLAWAASALWHHAQSEPLHHLHHPSAAQRNLQPPAAHLTLGIVTSCCSLLRSQWSLAKDEDYRQWGHD